MAQDGELSIPPEVEENPNAAEILRAWVDGESMHVILRSDVHPDAGVWGIYLVDIARHVANALEQSDGRDREQVLARIREVFDAEWDSPTDTPEGHIQD